MLNLFKAKQPQIVSRFIGNKNFIDEESNVVKTNVFDTPRNRKDGEISVFDIDDELKQNNDEKIFKIGDKFVYKKPPYTIARADLCVSEINKIEINDVNLDIVKGRNKHYNIMPFDDAMALHIAGQLVSISKLTVR